MRIVLDVPGLIQNQRCWLSWKPSSRVARLIPTNDVCNNAVQLDAPLIDRASKYVRAEIRTGSMFGPKHSQCRMTNA
jgi:hypothetical protein